MALAITLGGCSEAVVDVLLARRRRMRHRVVGLGEQRGEQAKVDTSLHGIPAALVVTLPATRQPEHLGVDERVGRAEVVA